MQNEKTETTTLTPIDNTLLENVTGGCNGAVGGCVNCGDGTPKAWNPREEQQ